MARTARVLIGLCAAAGMLTTAASVMVLGVVMVRDRISDRSPQTVIATAQLPLSVSLRGRDPSRNAPRGSVPSPYPTEAHRVDAEPGGMAGLGASQ